MWSFSMSLVCGCPKAGSGSSAFSSLPFISSRKQRPRRPHSSARMRRRPSPSLTPSWQSWIRRSGRGLLRLTHRTKMWTSMVSAIPVAGGGWSGVSGVDFLWLNGNSHLQAKAWPWACSTPWGPGFCRYCGLCCHSRLPLQSSGCIWTKTPSLWSIFHSRGGVEFCKAPGGKAIGQQLKKGMSWELLNGYRVSGLFFFKQLLWFFNLM